jgi:hypothetical protein
LGVVITTGVDVNGVSKVTRWHTELEFLMTGIIRTSQTTPTFMKETSCGGQPLFSRALTMSTVLAGKGLPMIVLRVRFLPLALGTGVTRIPAPRQADMNGASYSAGASTTTPVPVPLATMKAWCQVSSSPFPGRLSV